MHHLYAWQNIVFTYANEICPFLKKLFRDLEIFYKICNDIVGCSRFFFDPDTSSLKLHSRSHVLDLTFEYNPWSLSNPVWPSVRVFGSGLHVVLVAVLVFSLFDEGLRGLLHHVVQLPPEGQRAVPLFEERG